MDEKEKFTGKWIGVYERNGHEFVRRLNKNEIDAVVIIPFIKIDGEIHYQLISHFRESVGKTVLEFPAGLLDENETVQDGALRELKEETGWTGKVVEVSQPCLSSPGLSDEKIVFVKVELLEFGEKTDNLEEIKILPLITKKQINALNKCEVSARVTSYFLGV
jgi:8-oxo-dGTP pyrophosphatase MutT (NUDIX family)